MNRRLEIILAVLVAALAGSAGPARAQSWPTTAPRLEQRSFTSALVGSRSFYVYLPPGYDSTAERYPIVVLLRGVETEWITPNQDAARRGSIMTVADTLWRSGVLPPAILVMPRIGSPPTWNDMTSIADELIPWVDARYRTIPTRWHRSVDGFSYGGLGSAMLITQAPERFISAGGYDGSLFLYDPARLQLWRPERHALYAAMQFLYTTTGPNESGNQSTNRAFVDTLAAYGIANGYAVLNLAPDAQHNWYFADLHVSRTLPRHGARMAAAPQRLTLTTAMPSPGSAVSGTVSIAWTVPDPPPSLRVFVQVSRDAGRRWYDLIESASPDSSIGWNTLGVPDGTRYHVRVIAAGDTSFRDVRTAGTFSVDNPGDGAPDVDLTTTLPPFLTGNAFLRWRAADPEGSPVTTSVHVSSDDGVTWTTLAAGRAAVDSLFWPTADAANGTRYRLRIVASDGSTTGELTTGRFSVTNERQRIPYAVERVNGRGDLEVRAFAQHNDPNLTAPFRILIHRTLSDVRYSVRSVPEDSLLVPPTLVGLPGEEGPLFEGKRLALTIVDTPAVWTEQTRWIVGHSNIAGTVSLPTLTIDNVTHHGIPTPDDYLITTTSNVSDTAMAAFGLPEQPVRFTVRTAGTEAQPSFIYLDPDGSGGLSHGDEIYFVPSGKMLPIQLGWWVVFSSPSQAILPAAGDQFQVRIRKPPFDGDAYVASLTATSIQELVNIPVRVTLDPAYPNPFNPTTRVRYRLADRMRATLTVVDLLGRRVATLAEGLHAAGEFTAVWNAAGCSSGVYFLRLQAGSAVATQKLVLIR